MPRYSEIWYNISASGKDEMVEMTSMTEKMAYVETMVISDVTALFSHGIVQLGRICTADAVGRRL